MTTNILFLILSSFIFIILLWILIIEIRLKRIFAGIKVKNIESLIGQLASKTKELDEYKNKTNSQLEIINKRLNRSIRNIEIERYGKDAVVSSPCAVFSYQVSKFLILSPPSLINNSDLRHTVICIVFFLHCLKPKNSSATVTSSFEVKLHTFSLLQ